LKPGQYKVLTSDTHSLATSLPDRYIYRINTGGPLPTGADAVIMVEDTELVTASADGEEIEVRTLAQLPPGENVRQPGSDVRQGDLILERGTLLASGGGEIGTLAFVGTGEVSDLSKLDRSRDVEVCSRCECTESRRSHCSALVTS
jgi:gephyrin